MRYKKETKRRRIMDANIFDARGARSLIFSRWDGTAKAKNPV
jgi:hypothetical protein